MVNVRNWGHNLLLLMKYLSLGQTSLMKDVVTRLV